MTPIFADLHIHSCLSPCAEMDMTPMNICAMAKLKGLNALAITDHNSARNLPAAYAAARAHNLVLLPGLEVNTREEVHLLAYFPTVDQALAAGEYFSSHLPKTPNVPRLFGEQVVMGEDDEPCGEEERMLIAATDVPLKQAVQEVEKLGGLAVPAHVNRGANGMLVNLGFFPADIEFPAVEVCRDLPVDARLIRGKKVLRSSDAHRLSDILEPVFSLEVQELSAAGVLHALTHI